MLTVLNSGCWYLQYFLIDSHDDPNVQITPLGHSLPPESPNQLFKCLAECTPGPGFSCQGFAYQRQPSASRYDMILGGSTTLPWTPHSCPCDPSQDRIQGTCTAESGWPLGIISILTDCRYRCVFYNHCAAFGKIFFKPTKMGEALYAMRT